MHDHREMWFYPIGRTVMFSPSRKVVKKITFHNLTSLLELALLLGSCIEHVAYALPYLIIFPVAIVTQWPLSLYSPLAAVHYLLIESHSEYLIILSPGSLVSADTHRCPYIHMVSTDKGNSCRVRKNDMISNFVEGISRHTHRWDMLCGWNRLSKYKDEYHCSCLWYLNKALSKWIYSDFWISLDAVLIW